MARSLLQLFAGVLAIAVFTTTATAQQTYSPDDWKTLTIRGHGHKTDIVTSQNIRRHCRIVGMDENSLKCGRRLLPAVVYQRDDIKAVIARGKRENLALADVSALMVMAGIGTGLYWLAGTATAGLVAASVLAFPLGFIFLFLAVLMLSDSPEHAPDFLLYLKPGASYQLQ